MAGRGEAARSIDGAGALAYSGLMPWWAAVREADATLRSGVVAGFPGVRDRRKHDRKDAKELTQLLPGGEAVTIRVASQREERMRDLVRYREMGGCTASMGSRRRQRWCWLRRLRTSDAVECPDRLMVYVDLVPG